MADVAMAENNLEGVSGPERAAIFMMSLGEKNAAEVLKHMAPRDVQKLGLVMSSLSNVSNEKVESVVGKFVETANAQSGVGVDSDEYIKNMLNNALGEDKAGGIIDRILVGKNSKGLESLKWMDPRAVAEVVKNEHPQIIAIVLSYLESDHAAEILNYLPERARSDVLMRIATLDGVPPAALQELNEVLENQFSGSNNVQNSGVGGIKTAADILNFMDGASEAVITETITEIDKDLAEAIQGQMFVFENLLEVDDKGMQTILRDVQSEQLIVALKGADDTMKEKIFSNMSSRAADMMREDLEAKGPVKLKDVEDAQMEVLAIAKKLADSGEISLGGKGDEEYV
ncbi:Flagellar motor switch protein FliG [hydrothermal vent metagenome]|uniref:Flagellar motor switch protein FliG n=1 Tax=hydrothermal vent metagenome TaxID=652676 RepID=A0A3B0WSM6_9ZZZZ